METEDAVLNRRVDSIFDWFQSLLKRPLPQGDFFDLIKDGTILCQVMNALKAGTIATINEKKHAFAQLQNMNAFLNASELMGVPKEFLAKASDVVEGKNRMRTVQTIFLLSLAAEKKKLRVPFLQHPDLRSVRRWEIEIPPEDDAVPLALNPSAPLATSTTTSLAPDTPGSWSTSSIQSLHNLPPVAAIANDQTIQAVLLKLENVQALQRATHQTLSALTARLDGLELTNRAMSKRVDQFTEGFVENLGVSQRQLGDVDAALRRVVNRVDEADNNTRIVMKSLASIVATTSAVQRALETGFLTVKGGNQANQGANQGQNQVQNQGEDASDEAAAAAAAADPSTASAEETPRRRGSFTGSSVRKLKLASSKELFSIPSGAAIAMPPPKDTPKDAKDTQKDAKDGQKDQIMASPAPLARLGGAWGRRGSVALDPSSLPPTEEGISLPQAHTAVKTKRWYETDEAQGVDITTLSKEEVSRQDGIYELINSEADYVNDLQVMIDVHMKRLRESKAVSEADMQGLFSNLVQIKTFNFEFLEELKKRRAETPIVPRVGDVFLKMIEYFKVYTAYCSNHANAGKLLKTFMLENSDVRQLLDHLMNDVPETRHLSLESFLIKPVQRICKYPLLLKEILKHTPDTHADHLPLKSAMERIESVLSAVNDRAQAADESQKILLLQSSIESAEPLELLHPSRRLFMEGNVNKVERGGKLKERYLVLFNDLLLICKPLSSFGSKMRKYQLVRMIRADMFLVNGSEAGGVKNSFTIIVVGQEKMEIVTNTEEERHKWVRLLEQASSEQLAKAGKPMVGGTLGRVGGARAMSGSPVPVEATWSGKGSHSRAASYGEAEAAGVRRRAHGVSGGSGRSDSDLPHPDSIDNTLDDLYLSLTDHWASSEYEISFPAHSLLLVRAKPLINHYKVEMKGVVGYISPSAVRPVTQDDVKEKDRADVINGLKFKAAPVGVMTCPAFAMDDRASARSGGSSGGKASSNSGKKGKETASRPRFTESLRIALGGGGSEMSLPSMGSASLERRGSLSSVTFGQEKAKGSRTISKTSVTSCGRTWFRVTLHDDASTSYYYCPATLETAWAVPPEDGQQYNQWVEAPVAEHPDWVEIDNNGLVYYYHRRTLETRWDSPAIDDREVF